MSHNFRFDFYFGPGNLYRDFFRKIEGDLNFQFYGELIFWSEWKTPWKLKSICIHFVQLRYQNIEIYFSIIGKFKGTFLYGFIGKIHMSRNNPSVEKESACKKMSCLIFTGLFYPLYTSYNPQMRLLLSDFNRRKLKTSTKKKSKMRKFLEFYPWKLAFLPVKKLKKHWREKKPWAWKKQIKRWKVGVNNDFCPWKKPKKKKKWLSRPFLGFTPKKKNTA